MSIAASAELPPAAPKAPPKRREFLAMLVYVVVVYAWVLPVHPLGRDYMYLSGDFPKLGSIETGVPWWLMQIPSFEARWFGTTVALYHLVNLALLYGCMLLVYRLVNNVIAGPKWLGTLAACLFMANPVHTEALANLCGVVDLAPCLLALAALAAYTEDARRPTAWRWALSLVLFCVAVIADPRNLGLTLVPILFIVLFKEGRRPWTHAIPYVVIGAIWAVLSGTILVLLISKGHSLLPRLTPLYFLFYSIGFLPETAHRFHEQPWLAWLAAGAVVVVATLIIRKARRPAITFGLLAAVAVRITPWGPLIDPVHLVGGGQLLLAHALFVLALVALFYRIMDHPNWRSSVVSGTTLLCVVFFGMQIQSNLTWYRAGKLVRDFQARAQSAGAGNNVVILPNCQYYGGAPLCLSESVAHDTPFSRPLRFEASVAMHYDVPKRMRVRVERGANPSACVVRVAGKVPLDVMPWPYALVKAGAVQEINGQRMTLQEVGKGGFSVEIISPYSDLEPVISIPAGEEAASAGEEARP